MAQMPASYLTEKVDDLRVALARIDTSSGIIDLGAGEYGTTRLRLADMAAAAQAIIDEITEWTGVDA